MFLPETWTNDPERMMRAGVPKERQTALTKPEIAIEEIDRVIAFGARFGCVLADSGYGSSGSFRQALSQVLDERRRQLRRQWLHGTFNPAADGCTTIGKGSGALVWQSEGSGYRLTWLAPTGLACPLARIYAQDDGSWAVLVVAGVRDNPAEAMAIAEWGVSRLTA